MHKLLIGTSLSALLLATPALAQTTTAPAAPPAGQKEQMAPGTGTTAPAAMPTTPGTTTDRTPADRQTMAVGGGWSADDLIGTAVHNAANENIGNVNDLIVDAEGRITSVIVGVGGFLGIGERNVALKFDQIRVGLEGSDLRVVTDLDREAVQAMPEWQRVTR